MRKKLWLLILILVIIVGGAFLFIKFNPPLETGTLALDGNKKSVLVGVGNKGVLGIKIMDVLVNNDERPLQTKVQWSNALQGFIITDDYNSEESKKYRFVDIDDVIIKIGTSLSSSYAKQDNGSATEKDEIYGISVIFNSEIHKVHIKYSYFGIVFNKTVVFN